MLNRAETIEKRLQEALDPINLEIIDNSKSHAGHAGVQESGGGHFYATIVADVFHGKSLVQRHQLVYKALGDLMQTEIHAFSMKVFSPEEFEQQGMSL